MYAGSLALLIHMEIWNRYSVGITSTNAPSNDQHLQ